MDRLRGTVVQVRRFSNYNDGIAWLRAQVKGLTTDLVILPEHWVGTRILSEGEFSDYVEGLREVSNEANALIIGGAVYVSIDGRGVSVCPMVSGRGLVNYPEKIYPSKATGERLRIVGGSRLRVVRVDDWGIGCIICADAMYPELTRLMAMYGTDLIANPSSISIDRVQLWRSLGLIRAFENSAYFASAMGTGYKYPDGRDVLGGSFIASPNGEFVMTVNIGAEGLFTATINRGELEYARSRRGYIDDLRNGLSMGRVSVNITNA